MKESSKLFVAGHRGLAGSAIVRKLTDNGYKNIITRSHSELDLTDQAAVIDFFSHTKPEYVFLAAAKVGGILANETFPADFIYQNLMIQNNVIHQSFMHGVKKLLFLGSSCIYPKHCPQPIKEDYLMTGPLEETNAPYAMAKIAGIGMCRSYNRQYGTDFIPVMPTNMYGPNDNFDLKTSHVLPALIRKIHEAKMQGLPTVGVWGTGTPKREFLHADDMADAALFLMKKETRSPEAIYNIGTGKDITIKALAELIAEITGFKGSITYDTSKPDGTPRKYLDVSTLAKAGWQAKISLKDGLQKTYDWYLKMNRIQKSFT
jgi:GDP-L-fucose synthase